eukprot:jgi/Tetstr1/430290/TSEL_020115.t1
MSAQRVPVSQQEAETSGCTSQTSADAWLASGGASEAVAAAEASICLVSGASNFNSYLEDLTSAPGHNRSGCVKVWEQGAIAYRCKTCQVGPASAVCPACFKAGGHEDHDYIMYTSDAGGCCDCGDLSSWKASGCCPMHRPSNGCSCSNGCTEGETVQKLPEVEERLMRELLASAIASIVYSAESAAAMTKLSQSPASVQLEDFPSSLAWLHRCCEVPQLRILAVEEMCRPVMPCEDSPAGSPSSTSAEPILSGARSVRMELFRRLTEGRHLKSKETVRHPSSKRGKCPLLTRLLHAVGDLWHPCLSDLTTLLMLMLYESSFKYQFTRCLCPYYPAFMSKAIVNTHLRTALDRLTVQLFSIPSVTLRLAQEDNLLEFFFGLLHEIFKRAAGGKPDAPVYALHEQLSRLRSHQRVLMDLKMILCHTEVVVYLFTQNFRALNMLLNCLQSMQGMCAHTRKSGAHMQHENMEWGEAIMLEQQVLQLVSQMVKCLTHMPCTPAEEGESAQTDGKLQGARQLLHCIPDGRQASVDTAVASLVAGAELALRRACMWAAKSGSAGQLSMPLLGKYLFDGAPVSLHLPLHRTAAICIQALMEISARGGAQASDAKNAIELLMSGKWMKQHQTHPSPAVWQLIALHPLQILVWLAQVRARLWLRNGESLMKIDAFYRSAFWHDIAMDMDYLILQTWLASITTDQQSQAMMWILEAFGAQPMFRGMSSQSMETQQITPMQISESQLACAIMGLKLLVTLLRESHLTCDPGERLKHEIIHQLAVADQGHHQLCETVAPERLEQESGSALLDEVLAEVAVYVDPDLKQRGRYRLKKDCWELFDPLFLHYLPNELQEAMERAQNVGHYTPHLNLTPRQPLPQELARIQDVLSCQRCQRVIWTCLKYAKLFPSSGSYELVFVAVHLLALTLKQQEKDPGEGQDSSQSSMCSMMAGADPVCTPGGLSLLQSLLPGIAKDLLGCVEHIMPTLQQMQTRCKCHPAGSPPNAGRDGCTATCHSPPQAGAQGRCCGQHPRKRDSVEGAHGAEASDDRKQRAKQRQQEMMQRMALQQAAFSAQSDEPAGSGNGAERRAASPPRGISPAAPHEALRGSPSNGNHVANGSGATSSEDSPVEASLVERARAGSFLTIPKQHPAAWVMPAGECVFCHLDDPDCGPLGRLCYVRVNPVPAYASRDYSSNWKRLQRWVEDTPTDKLGDVQQRLSDSAADSGSHSRTTSDSGSESRAFQAAPSSYTAPSTLEACDQHSYAAGGPMLSEVDCRPGLSVLGCGHMIHFTCLQAMVKTPSSTASFLCPICRRQSNAVVPAAGSSVGARSADRARLDVHPSAGEATSLQIVRKSRSMHELSDSSGLTPQAMLEAAVAAAEQAAEEATAYVASELAPSLHHEEGPWQDRLGHRGQMALAFLKQCQQQLRNASAQAERSAAASQELEPDVVAEEELGYGHHRNAHGGQADGTVVGPSACAWGVLSHNLVQWEIMQRPMSGTSRIAADAANGAGAAPPCEPAPPASDSGQAEIVNTAYWRLLKGLANLAMACGSEFHTWTSEDDVMGLTSPGSGSVLRPPAPVASSPELPPWQELLCWLMPSEQPSAPPSAPPIGVHASLCPRLKYDCRPGADSHSGPGLGPSGSTFPQPLQRRWRHVIGDPFLLLMELLALMTSTVCPRDAAHAAGPAWIAPAGAMAAVLPLLYTIAVNQAAMLAVAICSTYDLTDSCGDPASVFGFLTRELKRYVGEDHDRGGPSGHARLMEAVAVQVFPFLHRAMGLWALVTDGVQPGVCAPRAADADGNAGYLGAVESMAAALGLPSLPAALEVPNRHANPPVLLAHWCRRLTQQLPTISERALWLTRSRMSIPRCLRRPGLLPLPQLYHHLFLALGKCVCDACGKPPRDPALCLSTGAFLCCDGHDGCMSHAWEHGAGTGVFLLIKTTQLLVVRNAERMCNSHPSLCIYLDAHGEEDPWMERGRALHLSLPRYKWVASLWSAAAMDFDTAIVHASVRMTGAALHPSGARRLRG